MRVSGFGLRSSSFEFHNLGFGVLGVLCLEFRVPSFTFLIVDLGVRVFGPGFRVSGFISGFGFQNLCALCVLGFVSRFLERIRRKAFHRVDLCRRSP